MGPLKKEPGKRWADASRGKLKGDARPSAELIRRAEKC